MAHFLIDGKHELSGEIAVKGAKNFALKAIAAVALMKKDVILRNVPDIEDIAIMLQLFEHLGGKVRRESPDTYVLSPASISQWELDPTLSGKVRTSILFVAPLLARFGKARFVIPGGDRIGQRPIDLFLEGFTAFGATMVREESVYTLTAPRLTGTEFVFPWISNTVTESLIIAAVMAHGKTVLYNTALEPEVMALCTFLKKSGARITGEGTYRIEITGPAELTGGDVTIIPDRIETGTFAILGTLLGKRMRITHADPTHLEVFWRMLKKTGAAFEIKNDTIEIAEPTKQFHPCEIRTREYPGFPTDLQPIFTTLLTQAKGLSLVHETIHEGRMFYTDSLNRMGAHIIMCDPHRVVVNGPTPLYAKSIASPDIRAGMALVIAALIAEGRTEMHNIYQIDRGYECIEERLQDLGAHITRE